MNFELAFLEDALKEWRKPDPGICEQFKKKLDERLLNLDAPSAQLSGSRSRYKIKLRQASYRLVYEVRDKQPIVLVGAVGKRERNAAYKAAERR